MVGKKFPKAQLHYFRANLNVHVSQRSSRYHPGNAQTMISRVRIPYSDPLSQVSRFRHRLDAVDPFKATILHVVLELRRLHLLGAVKSRFTLNLTCRPGRFEASPAPIQVWCSREASAWLMMIYQGSTNQWKPRSATHFLDPNHACCSCYCVTVQVILLRATRKARSQGLYLS